MQTWPFFSPLGVSCNVLGRADSLGKVGSTVDFKSSRRYVVCSRSAVCTACTCHNCLQLIACIQALGTSGYVRTLVAIYDYQRARACCAVPASTLGLLRGLQVTDPCNVLELFFLLIALASCVPQISRIWFKCNWCQEIALHHSLLKYYPTRKRHVGFASIHR